MKRFKSILGILLIILSIAGLLFWEWKGRDVIFMEEVLVAKEAIQKGTEVNSSMFITTGVPKENLLSGALIPDEINRIQGKVVSQFIAGNDQIIMDYFRTSEFYLAEDESIFVIEPEWVVMRSSSLRRGDVVDIYSNNGGGLIGTFMLAFVKDEVEREVKDVGDETHSYIEQDILKRTDSTSVIDHIEIITTLSEYEKLVSYVNAEIPSSLIIVQRGEKIDT